MLSSYFLFVADNLAEDGGKAIVAGNERVLRARLADARFFWDQDRKIRLEDRVEALKRRVYHDRLGSVYDKAERMECLAVLLARQLFAAGALERWARRASRLAKADLSTAMVGEFPELQGIMGRYYALDDGEEQAVADAIAEHYKPLGASDTCPTAPAGVVAALSDKLDTLVAFFAISLAPTGSRDPFALRRCALGVIRIILENRLRLPLEGAIRDAARIFYRQQGDPGMDDRIPPLVGELMTFIVDRLKVHLREQRVRHDLVAAAFSQPATAEDDLVRLLARVDALREFTASADGVSLLIAYRRAANIVGIEENRDGQSHRGPTEPELLCEPEERSLADRLEEVRMRVEPLLRDEEFAAAMMELTRLRQPVDEFFDKVTVNSAEPSLRENRLRLLSGIRSTMNRVADFSEIEG